jgi:flagellar hook protein FlgE
MLDSINVGMTGLQGYAKGLRVIANNTANLNTPGYKGSSLQFTDLFYANGGQAGRDTSQLGYGLASAGTHLDMRAGDLRQTGNEFDLGVDGEGLFVLRDADGQTRYTRAGQFELNTDGVLVHRGDGSKAVGVDASGRQTDVGVGGLRTVAGTATTSVRFTGNISSTSLSQTLPAVKVFDALGAEHSLSVKFSRAEADTTGAWQVEVLEGATSVGTGSITFADGRPTAATAKIVVSYAPGGQPARDLTLDFSQDATSFASGTLSTLAMSSQDGKPPGQFTKAAFDEQGQLVLSYSNGDTVKGARLLLARMPSNQAARQTGGNQFAAVDGLAWELAAPGSGGLGAVRSGVVEMSNVDLSREFTELVVMQRGYQASSQVISSANDMLQELFRMKAK